jgi:hypothetical protein
MPQRDANRDPDMGCETVINSQVPLHQAMSDGRVKTRSLAARAVASAGSMRNQEFR